ncbi:MAG: hypothetical protein HKM90_00235 [Desulfobacteraceae bacterium]|nr:hypothetical protein [Desulfobacteraceae bacterium]
MPDVGEIQAKVSSILFYQNMPECPVLQSGDEWHPLPGGMGGSFQADNHLPGGCRTAPKSNIIMVVAPQRKVALMTDLLCACPGSAEYLAWGR